MIPLNLGWKRDGVVLYAMQSGVALAYITRDGETSYFVTNGSGDHGPYSTLDRAKNALVKMAERSAA